MKCILNIAHVQYSWCAIYRDPTVALQLSLFSQGGLFYVILYYRIFKVDELTKIIFFSKPSRVIQFCKKIWIHHLKWSIKVYPIVLFGENFLGKFLGKVGEFWRKVGLLWNFSSPKFFFIIEWIYSTRKIK